jgi:glycosyltransferase involved in cell wall biosynthesis
MIARMLVSILIPCFNAERWVGQAIESALAQTWPEKEVIVVDDGSTDRSLDVIRRFDRHIHWETGPNRGGGAARNRLMELATGPWLQYLDADDYLLPEKISRQMEFSRRHPEAEIICSPLLVEDMVDGTVVRYESSIPKPRDPWVLLALWALPQTGGPLWKRAALQRVGGWRVGQPCCQEHELYGRLLEAGGIYDFCDDCLAVYRIWELGDRLVRRMSHEIPVQRLKILNRMEQYLIEQSQLTAPRRQAINDARHQIARRVWLQDQETALEIVELIRHSDERFCPSEGPASPRSYRAVYRWLGFRATQRIADLARFSRPTPAG